MPSARSELRALGSCLGKDVAVTTRSGRGRWQRVLEARAQAQLALGGVHGFTEKPPKRGPEPQDIHRRRAVPYVPGHTEYVLSLGEAAARLDLSRDELELLIAAGKVRTLPTELTQMVPTAEIERLTRR